MLSSSFLTVVLSISYIVSASAPQPRQASRNQKCVVPSSNDASDDSSAIASAFAQCSSDSIIEFSAGVNYNVFKPIKATNLSNVELAVNGNLHLPQDIASVRAIVNGSGTQFWFQLGGSNIDYIGSQDVNNGWIYSYGQAWWDANPVNGTGIAGRPHLMSFFARQGSMRYFKSMKPIGWNVKVSGNDIAISNAIIDAYSTSGSFPFNTDGFDVSGTNIAITDSVIYNGDDAIAVGDGSHNIVFQHNTIGYQTHGMSIGSLGSNAASFVNVSNVLFDDNTVINGVYGARFKSWQGGQGLAKNITWSNIRVYNVTFPIFVTQTYLNQDTNQVGSSTRPNNSSVNMQDFTWRDFTGTINTFRPGDGSCASDPCWYNVGLLNLSHTEAIIIECNTETSCNNFQVSDIEVFPQNSDPPTVICINARTSLNLKLGFDCANGTYVPS